MGYNLANDIYSSINKNNYYSTKIKHFAIAQKYVKKYVEHAFRVLQSRFAIVRGVARYSYNEVVKDIMDACIILRNMIVEAEHHQFLGAN